MSRSAEVTLPFGGEERKFRLALGQLRALQEKCDAGPAEIARRLGGYIRFGALRQQAAALGRVGPSMIDGLVSGLGEWRVDDVRETIFQGLLGAKVDHAKATRLVIDNVDGYPLTENIPIAFAILSAVLVGAEDEDAAGERPAGEAERPSREARSGSEPTASTPSAAPRASRRAKSTNSPSGSSRPPSAAG